MSNMTKEEVELLIKEYEEWGEIYAEANRVRKAIRDKLVQGRTLGVTRDFYKILITHKSEYSAYMLKKLVPASILSQCRVSRSCRSTSVRIVPKLKPRKPKLAKGGVA